MTEILTRAGRRVRDSLVEGASRAYAGAAMAPTRDRTTQELSLIHI